MTYENKFLPEVGYEEKDNIYVKEIVKKHNAL